MDQSETLTVKTLYLECNMGAAGDMLLAALLELHPDPGAFVDRLNRLGLPKVQITAHPSVKCGILGTHVSVKVDGVEEESCDVHAGHDRHHGHDHDHDHGQPHDHRHTGIATISDLLNRLDISDRVRSDALAVYNLIAAAESKAHGEPVTEVHFHEVGMVDAVADIVGVCMLVEELAPDRIMASPVHVGSGMVRCAHGILPVPAPATALILQGVPTYGGRIEGELCTPTGAALLKHFVTSFGDRPVMATEKIGTGMGKKDFPAANCVRAFLAGTADRGESVCELVCNVDDMTGEELGFALEQLMESGALDVYIVPVQMKKSRPGHMVVCLCRPEEAETMAAAMLRNTTSFGVRSSIWRRTTLEREITASDTAFGPVRVKTGRGFGVVRSKPEYEDLAALAREKGLSLLELKAELNR